MLSREEILDIRKDYPFLNLKVNGKKLYEYATKYYNKDRIQL